MHAHYSILVMQHIDQCSYLYYVTHMLHVSSSFSHGHTTLLIIFRFKDACMCVASYIIMNMQLISYACSNTSVHIIMSTVKINYWLYKG